ncbi:MAG: NAD(P)-dependent oxidoreductase [Caldilineaceae bacterium]
MKVLITGASGKLGAFVIRALRDDHELVLFSRSQPADEFAGLAWVQGDLADFAAVQRAVDGVDAIQHIGAQPWPPDHPAMRPGRSPRHPLRRHHPGQPGRYVLPHAGGGGRGRADGGHGGQQLRAGPRLPHQRHAFPNPLPAYRRDPLHLPRGLVQLHQAAGKICSRPTAAYGIRTYVTRIAGVFPPERRTQFAQDVQPVTAWSPWMWCWVGSEDVAAAHRLLMEQAERLPMHDVYFLNADDTLALEPSREIVARFRPELLPLVHDLADHASFISNQKLKAATGWRHQTSWRETL